ncbi:MAG TPA: hypothetical protein VFZ34_30910 [Blastocatellia bacterium]|nr:hypothetical protein [Blastocatellia bacterium]
MRQGCITRTSAYRSVGQSLFFLFLLVWCGALNADAQERRVKRLSEVIAIFVRQEDKSDQRYLNEVLPWAKDQEQRQERLTWLRTVRQLAPDKLAHEELLVAAKEPQAADALLSLAFGRIPKGEPLESLGEQTDPNNITATLTSHGKTLWTASYSLQETAQATAEKIGADIRRVIQKDREKQKQKK